MKGGREKTCHPYLTQESPEGGEECEELEHIIESICQSQQGLPITLIAGIEA